MLLVDSRVGSKDLLTPLRNQGVPAEYDTLEFGDFAFVGRGKDDVPVTIGIERKKFHKDFLNSMWSERFSGHQLRGLQRYDRAWLVTEGIIRANDEGVMEIMEGGWKPISLGRKRVMYCDVQSWILTQVIRGGIGYYHAPTQRDLVLFIAALYHWWTDKSLDEHRAHQAIYTPPMDRQELIEPSDFRKMAVGIPGIGWEKTLALEEKFGSFEHLIMADEKELQEVPGIGKGLAKTIYTTLRKKG